MKSVEIPCCLADEDENARLELDRDSDTLDIWSYEGEECNQVCLDREGVKKLIAAAQEWLQNSPE